MPVLKISQLDFCGLFLPSLGLESSSWWSEHTTPSPVAAEQSFLITHGTTDPLLPLAQTQAQMEQLQAGGIRMQWEVFEKEHTIQGEGELDVIQKFVEERMTPL